MSNKPHSTHLTSVHKAVSRNNILMSKNYTCKQNAQACTLHCDTTNIIYTLETPICLDSSDAYFKFEKFAKNFKIKILKICCSFFM